MHTITVVPALQAADGPTTLLGVLVDGIPKDPVSLFTMVLLVLCVLLVLWFGRKGSNKSGPVA